MRKIFIACLFAMLCAQVFAEDADLSPKDEANETSDAECKKSGGMPGLIMGCNCPSGKKSYSFPISAQGKDFTGYACKADDKKPKEDKHAKAKEECGKQNKVWNQAKNKCEGSGNTGGDNKNDKKDAKNNKGGNDDNERNPDKNVKDGGIENNEDNKNDGKPNGEDGQSDAGAGGADAGYSEDEKKFLAEFDKITERFNAKIRELNAAK